MDVDVELREYQKELAKRGCEGNNVIVMAPTNTGKTRVAFRIMQVLHLFGDHTGNKGYGSLFCVVPCINYHEINISFPYMPFIISLILPE